MSSYQDEYENAIAGSFRRCLAKASGSGRSPNVTHKTMIAKQCFPLCNQYTANHDVYQPKICSWSAKPYPSDPAAEAAAAVGTVDGANQAKQQPYEAASIRAGGGDSEENETQVERIHTPNRMQNALIIFYCERRKRAKVYKTGTLLRVNHKTVPNKVVFMDRKKANGSYPYVTDKDGEIFFGKRSNPNDPSKRAPHPTLIGGKHPEVQVVGMITFKSSKISSVDNQSGHYRPIIQSMAKVDAALQKLCDSNPDLFYRNSTWRKK